MRSTDADFPGRNASHDRRPVMIDHCPHCGEEVREEVGRLITNRQAVCSFCGLTIDLGREQMIAVIDKVQEALSRGGAGGDDGQ
jgi:transcription elongation factor Elf1